MPDHIQEAERFLRNIRDELEVSMREGLLPLITLHPDFDNHPLGGRAYEILGPQKEKLARIEVAGEATNEPYHVTIEERHPAIVEASEKLFSTRRYDGFGIVRIYGEHVKKGVSVLQDELQ